MESESEPEMQIEKYDSRTKQRGYGIWKVTQATTSKIHLFTFALNSVEQGRKGISWKPKFIQFILQLLYAAFRKKVLFLEQKRGGGGK
ncbi:uncharacterized protein EAE97_006534 [Botrytis byssoidea]|uniref:Uncharacterized protein n=1 Tax=Botrytis byssoidea TaxID=139641 RepID=A0A9P5ILR5_9HELO|nr:uncharacterized protein EAE97_006534 [Botrytis byssoidea]KAF7941697.1 hypothetical protein EAE97_006534 [Botrytis byssoidea]